MPTFFQSALVYLTAAVIAVPLAKRLGLGSVLGYLIAGIAVGPACLAFVGDETHDVMHFAEFGVVMMLFLVGLELRPSLLWKLRAGIFGMGLAQVTLTAAAVAAVLIPFVESWQFAAALGLIVALSSTAIALQTLAEKNLTKTRAGQSAFTVLLFQDIAVIPMLALLPFLATLPLPGSDGDHGGHAHTWTEGFPAWGKAAATLGAVAVIVLAGRFLSSHLFRMIARTGLREIFTAAALLLVVAIAVLMEKVGLSPALGAFVAGVVLSENEYRHELESDIAPFKGLLLGLFFIAVGASIDFPYIGSHLGMVLGLVAGLIAIKAVVLLLLSKWGKLGCDQGILFTVTLAQGGEFAFVLASFCLNNGVLPEEVTKPLIATVALSMAAAPILFIINDRLLQPRIGTRESEPGGGREADEMDEDAPVILVGFGRFGNVLGRFLRARDIDVTVLEHDSDHVDFLRKIGIKVFYGDATRLDLLLAAGAERARIIVIAIEDEEKSLELVHACRKHFPSLKILVRACSRDHAYRLLCADVDHFVFEQQPASLNLGVEVLSRLGEPRFAAYRSAQKFRKHDCESIAELAAFRDDQKAYIDSAKRRIEDLENRIASDDAHHDPLRDKAWDDSSLRDGF